MTGLTQVVYVGNKPEAFDNVARSGKCWRGKGDIQDVTYAQAKALLKYPDQWRLEDDADLADVMAPEQIKATDEDGTVVDVDPTSFDLPLEKMTRPEMMAYAKHKWGKKLPANMRRKAMIDQIEEWIHELG